MAPILLLVASLFLFWLASDLNAALGNTYLTTGTTVLGLACFLWAVVEAWQIGMDILGSD